MPEVAIRRLLCPTDFSALSRRAFGLALALAERHAAELRVIHVAPRRRRVPRASRAATARALEAWDEVEPAEMSRLVASAPVGRVTVSGGVLDGDVVAAILGDAAAWSADLIVMGSHGQAQRAGWTVGSVTEQVLHSARCPVLVAPRRAAPEAPGPARLDRILCPLDFSEPAQRSLDYALAFARAWGSRLTLLHVLEWFPGGGGGDEASLNVPEYQMDFSELARERLRRAFPREAHDWCPREEAVAVGQPHREILRVARERAADLIALGVHGRRAIDRRVFGATVCHVLREASCPVLAVRPA